MRVAAPVGLSAVGFVYELLHPPRVGMMALPTRSGMCALVIARTAAL